MNYSYPARPRGLRVSSTLVAVLMALSLPACVLTIESPLFDSRDAQSARDAAPLRDVIADNATVDVTQPDTQSGQDAPFIDATADDAAVDVTRFDAMTPDTPSCMPCTNDRGCVYRGEFCAGSAACIDGCCGIGPAPPPGTSCGMGMVCTPSGTCERCIDGAECDTGNECTIGRWSCSNGGASCQVTGNVSAGHACSAGVCNGNGACVSFGGAFERGSESCAECPISNIATGMCTCPPGFTSFGDDLALDYYCGRTEPTPIEMVFCGLGSYSPGRDFGGIYEEDLSVRCSATTCVRSNPYTGSCSCPRGTTPISFSIWRRCASDLGTMVPTTLNICTTTGSAPFVSFGGAFMIDSRGDCHVVNPRTGACSCPSSTRAQSLYVLAGSTGTLLTRMRIQVCVNY